MKTVLRLLACSALAITSVAARAVVTENFAQTYPIASTGRVSLSNVNGSVEIIAWDKAEVSLVAEKRAKDDEALKRITIEIDATPDRLTVRTKQAKKSGWSFFGNWNNNSSVTYKLMVPAGAKLDQIEVVNANITVKGMSGAVHLETVNGRIDASDLAGDAHLETVNGSLHASFASLAQVRQVKLESVNGSASVTLPKGASASIKTSSVNGSSHIDQPIKLNRSGRHGVDGDIGTGGPRINVETVNGSISIRAN